MPVVLLADESLTSWLVRTALAHGCDPTVLTTWLWPDWRAWMFDVDRGIPKRQHAALCREAGIKPKALEAAALGPMMMRLLGRTPERCASWTWVLTLGARGARRSGGTQLCPVCLSEDRPPYYRVQWRLAWHTACATHACLLHDRCPECESPIMAHRLQGDAAHIALCAACGTDLRTAPVRPGAGPALDLQSATDRVARDGAGECLGTPVDAPTWLAVADFLVRLVRRSARAPSLGLNALLESVGVDAPPALHGMPGAGIERLQIEERRLILNAVARIMALSADTLQETLNACGLTRQGWIEQGERAPGPLAAMAQALPERRSTTGRKAPRRRRIDRPRPRHEVLQMMARLERQHRARTQ